MNVIQVNIDHEAAWRSIDELGSGFLCRGWLHKFWELELRIRIVEWAIFWGKTAARTEIRDGNLPRLPSPDTQLRYCLAAHHKSGQTYQNVSNARVAAAESF